MLRIFAKTARSFSEFTPVFEADEANKFFAEQQGKIEMLEKAVKQNHQWHLDYDDVDGYQGSDLEDTNLKALGLKTPETE